MGAVLFPNPADDQCEVTFNTIGGPVNVTLYTLAGTRAMTIAETAPAGKNKLRINTSDLAPGVYVVEIMEESAVIRSRLVIAR
jgi:hypothetical protein